jgi:hypothetical protein
VSDELERTRNESFVAYFNVLPHRLAGTTDERHENLETGIRNRLLPNTMQEC